MKKSTMKLISAIISTGLIVSTIGATIAGAANANVKLVDNRYTNQHSWEIMAYYPVTGTEKSTYDTQRYEPELYVNAVKAVNYYNSLGFTYNNYVTFYNTGTMEFNKYKTNTVYISRTKDDGTTSISNMKGNANSAYGLITIGPVDKSYMTDMSCAQDVIAHEYVHLITQQLAGWDAAFRMRSVETGAIVEAYSDVLGELSEINPDWKMGTDLFKNNPKGEKCYRNMKDPSETKKPISASSIADRKFYSTYDELKAAYPLTTNDETIYAASTVISHAGYLMSTTGMKKEFVAELWLDSISLYPKNRDLTFSDCRAALIQAANNYADKNRYSYTNRNELLKRVNWSFDRVNIH